MLKWKVHECHDYEADFLDALRQCDAESFVFPWDDPRCQELAALKDDLHRLDEATERICLLKPEYQDRYKAQFQKAQKEIEDKIAALNIPNVKLYG